MNVISSRLVVRYGFFIFLRLRREPDSTLSQAGRYHFFYSPSFLYILHWSKHSLFDFLLSNCVFNYTNYPFIIKHNSSSMCSHLIWFFSFSDVLSITFNWITYSLLLPLMTNTIRPNCASPFFANYPINYQSFDIFYFFKLSRNVFGGLISMPY